MYSIEAYRAIILPCLFPCGAHVGPDARKAFYGNLLLQECYLDGYATSGRTELPDLSQMVQKITYFIRKTTYSNRKFDIIDNNK